MQVLFSRDSGRLVKRDKDGTVRTYEVGRSTEADKDADIALVYEGSDTMDLQEMAEYADNSEIEDFEKMFVTRIDQLPFK